MPASTPGQTQRPRVQSTKSYPRPDGSGLDSPSRTRSNTVHTPSITAVPEAKQLILSPEGSEQHRSSDIFDSSRSDDAATAEKQQADGAETQVQSLDQLPIEIRSFSERFLKSLSTKSHNAPLDIDAISDLFQDFYIQAESHISTHIAALTTRLSRDDSPTPSFASRRTVSAKASQDSLANQQMLTASEIADKRKKRRKLELQRTILEEAVERGVCEKVYNKIYRHRSTDDEEKDAKLRSKTAALSLMGIGLKELHVNIPDQGHEKSRALKKEVFERLAPARESLQRMDQERHPLGKLQHLTAAHQSIVETLAHIFPSTSSADEVLPTLIYTLITSPAESLSVASNLHFIQLFRASAKVDGEAAYCLVNLEAAISFLETVDLSSLRVDGLGEDPLSAIEKPEESGTDGLKSTEAKSLTADLPAVSNPAQKPTDREQAEEGPPQARPRPLQTQQRRISYLLQTQAERIEVGRENFLKSTDQAFDSINATLENSFKFVFGRLREQEAEHQRSPVLIPKTLDDARRLVKSPIQEEDEDALARSHLSLDAAISDDPLSRPADRMLSAVAGRRPVRDISADSTRSGGSNKRAPLFGGDDKAAAGPAEAVGNFVNALNPLSRFGVGVPGFAKFGRAASGAGPDSATEKSPTSATFPTADKKLPAGPKEDVDLNAIEALAQLRKAKPPVRRLIETQDVKELKIGDVEVLLQEYKRLAGLIGDALAQGSS